MTELSEGNVRAMGTNGRDGLELWNVSWYGKNRIVAFFEVTAVTWATSAGIAFVESGASVAAEVGS
jgi:hypothetical protein